MSKDGTRIVSLARVVALQDRIADLEADLERMTAARNRDHQQALANGAALAAERERREAAERLLHNYAALANDAMRSANCGGAEYDRAAELADYYAHFARYKD